jgi:hypothetical protein
MPSKRSREQRRLLMAIDAKIDWIRTFLNPEYLPLNYYFRNKIKMRAKGLARCAFNLRPDLREKQ